MTVLTTTAKAGPYAGAGTTGPFPVPFRFLDATHLRVIRTAQGVETVLALTADYTVTGVGAASGSVTLTAPLPVGQTLTVLRSVPATQEADYVPGDAFPAESHEEALDKLTMLVQQSGEELGRALRLPASASGVSSLVPLPIPGGILGWNNGGTGLTSLDRNSLATVVAYGTAFADQFTGDGVTTLFTLTNDPGVIGNLDVAVNGLTLTPGVDYTWVAGNNITFTSPPPLGAEILVRYLQGLPVGTMAAQNVSYQPAGTGAVPSNVQSKLREFVSVKDFGITGDVLIPTHFPDLQTAFDTFGPNPATDITVRIEAGHTLSSGLIVKDGDYSRYTVEADDSTVLLSASWPAGTGILTGVNARMPNWNIFVDCDGKNVNPGIDMGAINVMENSTLRLGNGAGCTNGASGNSGLFVFRNSKATGVSCVFTNFPVNNVWITHLSDGYLERVTATGAGEDGIFVSRASRAYCAGGDFSGAGNHCARAIRSLFVGLPAGNTPSKYNGSGVAGLFADSGSIIIAAERSGVSPHIHGSINHAVVASRGSVIDMQGASIDGVMNGDAIRVNTGATINAANVVGTNLGRDALVAGFGGLGGGTIYAPSATFASAGRYGINGISGGRVVAEGINLANAGETAVFLTNATADIPGATVSGSAQYGFDLLGSTAQARGCVGTGAGLRAARCREGSELNVVGANLSGAVFGGIRAETGSTVKASNCNAQAGAGPATSDVQIFTGSIVHFNGGTGGANVTTNTVSASGVIFR